MASYLYQIRKIIHFTVLNHWIFLHKLMIDFIPTSILINNNNLKMVIHSDNIRRFLHEHKLRFHFKFVFPSLSLEDLLYVVDEPVLPMANHIYLDLEDASELWKFRAPEQLERLKLLTGRSVAEILRRFETDGLLQYRHVYNYVLQRGQSIPLKHARCIMGTMF